MAANLVRAGHQVTVFNRNAAKRRALIELGARDAATIPAACEGDVVITMLANGAALRQVTLGDQGIVANLRKNGTHISMSTVSVDLTRELTKAHEQAGQNFVAAPVFGRPDMATAAKLFIIAPRSSRHRHTVPAAHSSRKANFTLRGSPHRSVTRTSVCCSQPPNPSAFPCRSRVCCTIGSCGCSRWAGKSWMGPPSVASRPTMPASRARANRFNRNIRARKGNSPERSAWSTDLATSLECEVSVDAKPNSNMRQMVLGAAAPIALMLVCAEMIGCSHRAQPTASLPPEVSVVTVHHEPVPVTTELPGRTSAYLVAQVRARVDGIVQQRAFAEGSDVSTNQRLYQIDPAPYQAALQSAQAILARARANLESTRAQAERDKPLLAGNAISKQQYLNDVAARDQAAADVASGIAAVQTAKINLGYTDVVSPITGRIGPSLVTQGAYVQASAATMMANVQQIDPIYVDLNQTSVEGLQLRQQVASGRIKLNGPDQTKVRLLLEDGRTYTRTGALQFTDISVDQTTGSVTVRAIFPNPDHVLLPGMFVRAIIDQGTSNAMLVPQDGVTHDRTGRASSLVVGADNKVTQQSVDAPRTLGDSWVVDNGLRDGDRVIVSGVQRVQPGMLVRAVPAQPGPRLARNTAEQPEQ